jgi:hypothetical protein
LTGKNIDRFWLYGVAYMDPLLGFLGTSAIAAIAGTAMKGILRPLSWAMLAAAVLLFGSSKIVDATNALNQNSALSQNPQLSPNPTSSLSSNSTIASPPLAQGWQAVAQGLNPSLSTLYGQNQPNQNQLSQNQPSPISPGELGQVEVGQSTPINQNPNANSGSATVAPLQPAAPPPRVSTTRPIAGLW